MFVNSKEHGNDGRETRPGHALYLYGLSEVKSANRLGKGNANQKSLTVAAAGVDGESKVRAVECTGVLAWVSEVDADEFAANLASKMEDLEWLSEASVRHQRAVAAIAEKAERVKGTTIRCGFS